MAKDDDVVIYRRNNTVVGKTGAEIEKRIDPSWLQVILMDDLQVAISRMNEHFKREEYIGISFPLTLTVTDQPLFYRFVEDNPYIPLFSADLVNRGGQSAFISINRDFYEFELPAGQSVTINRKGAEKRIEVLHYRCNTGLTTTVIVNGKY